MLNHSTNPEERNTTLFKFNNEMTVQVDGEDVSFKGFFTMKAGMHALGSKLLVLNILRSVL